MRKYLGQYAFDDVYSSCMVDGMDSWDSAWYALNYLPVVEDDTMVAAREEIEQMTFEEYLSLPTL